MTISIHNKTDNIIERELLSNSTNLKEYRETQEFFSMLKDIRVMAGVKLPASKTAANKKWIDFAMRLLLATAFSPIPAALGYLRVQNGHSHPLGTISRADPPLLAAGAALAYDYASDAALAGAMSVEITSRDSPDDRNSHKHRVSRSSDETHMLYLPSGSLATRNIKNFLVQKN
ncbi:hypothetical protein ABK905_06915 [Acerihabitans sp. KWT182]|uniref:Uncharacterized protein n=1 Tax=Acerihabitans sp. KWT182 TaxID=3157919 RepID=A0AAU7QCW9_9GAMM